MNNTIDPIDFFWFIPTSGDGAYLGASDLNRAPEIGYLRQVAIAADQLGYSGALLPTGVSCEESFVVAAALSQVTERLKFLVAIRPGVASPSYYARLAATLDRVSAGRALLNIVVGGNPKELAGDGVFLEHDTRYHHAEEFFTVWEELMEKGASTLEGEHIKAIGAQLGYPSVQRPRPPLFFGGSSDAGIEFAAGRVEKYLTWGEPPAQVAEKVNKVRAAAALRGREVTFGIRLHFIVRETDEEAWEAADRLISKLSDATIDEARRRFVKESDSVGQQRMFALHQGRRDKLEVSPNLWAGIGLVRAGAGTALVGSPATVAARLREYQEIGIDTVIGSGYPHLEESYRVAELLFPELGIKAPGQANGFLNEFGTAKVFAGGSHGGNLRAAS